MEFLSKLIPDIFKRQKEYLLVTFNEPEPVDDDCTVYKAIAVLQIRKISNLEEIEHMIEYLYRTFHAHLR